MRASVCYQWRVDEHQRHRAAHQIDNRHHCLYGGGHYDYNRALSLPFDLRNRISPGIHKCSLVFNDDLLGRAEMLFYERGHFGSGQLFLFHMELAGVEPASRD